MTEATRNKLLLDQLVNSLLLEAKRTKKQVFGEYHGITVKVNRNSQPDRVVKQIQQEIDRRTDLIIRGPRPERLPNGATADGSCDPDRVFQEYGGRYEDDDL